MKTTDLVGIIIMISALIIFSLSTAPAQTTSIVGTVYEKDQAKTTFNTPEGTIKVYLPDDIRPGDEVTGTVVAQPKGKNEQEKGKNLKKLMNYSLLLPGGVALTSLVIDRSGTLASATPKFTVPKEEPCSISLNSPDNEPYSSVEVPTIPVYIENITDAPSYVLAKKVITNTEPLVILQENTGGAIPTVILNKYYSPTYSGETDEQYILNPSVSSLRKAVYYLPENISGMFNVNIQLQDGFTTRIDLVNIVDVQATIGKGSLTEGERTRLDIEVSGLEGCPYSPVELEISNQSPGVVQLVRGNQQMLPVDHSDDPLGLISGEPYHSTQEVIGVEPGSFMVNTTLHIPPAAYANTVYPYIETSSSPEDYNANIGALRDDIDLFSEMDSSDPGVVSYLGKIRDKLPLVENKNDLQRAKSVTINMLNTLAAMAGGIGFLSTLPSLNKTNPDLARKTAVPQPVHPLHNYAGEFDPETKQLIVNPLCQEDLLDYLGAIKMSNGNYTFTLSDGTNPLVYSDVELKPAILDKDNSTFVAQDINNKNEFQLGEPTSATPIPESKRSKYRFYDHAECKTTREAYEGECYSAMSGERNEKTGELETKPTGQYKKNSYLGSRKCVQGKSICTEIEIIEWIIYIYDDEDCSRLIDIDTIKLFNCPK